MWARLLSGHYVNIGEYNVQADATVRVYHKKCLFVPGRLTFDCRDTIQAIRPVCLNIQSRKLQNVQTT